VYKGTEKSAKVYKGCRAIEEEEIYKKLMPQYKFKEM
jgi:hypothetical protein